MFTSFIQSKIDYLSLDKYNNNIISVDIHGILHVYTLRGTSCVKNNSINLNDLSNNISNDTSNQKAKKGNTSSLNFLSMKADETRIIYNNATCVIVPQYVKRERYEIEIYVFISSQGGSFKLIPVSLISTNNNNNIQLRLNP
eukprot:UN31142